jgi:two-component system cell cycle sensor histidine kinase/response regulator CckA
MRENDAMKFLRNISVSIKVLIPPAILVLALVAISALASYGLEQQRRTLSAVNDLALEKVSLVEEFIALSEQVQSDVFQIAVLRFMDLPEEEVQPVQTHLEQGVSDLNVTHGHILTKWSLDETEQAILERMQGPLDDFTAQAQQAVAAAASDPSFGVLLVRSSATPFTKFRDTLSEFLAYQRTKIVRAEAEASQKAQTARLVIVALALSISLVGIFSTVLMSTDLISQPIKSMTGLMQRLAAGDLSVTVDNLDRRDEIGAMAQAVDVFHNNAIEKARAEEALRASEENYRAIFNAANDAIFIHDIETGAILDVNPRMSEMFGYTPKEAQRLTVEAVSAGTPPYSQPEAMQWLKKAAEGEPQIFDWQCKDKTGRIFWTEVSLKRASIGGQDRVLALLRDITERKQAEETLRAEQEFIETILNTVQDTIFVFAPNTGKPLRWNRAFTEISGYTDEEIVSKKAPDEWYSEEDLKLAADTTERVLRGEQRTMQLSLITKDGTTVPTEYTGATIVDSEGKPQYIVAVGRDITERKRAEEEIQWLSKFPGENPNPVLRVASDGTVLYANQAASSLLDEWRSQVGHRLPKQWQSVATEALSGPSSKRAEVTIAEQVLSLTFAPVESAGYVNVYGLDITDRVRSEQERAQAEGALRESNHRLEETLEELRDAQERMVQQERLAAVGQLAAGIAHDFNNILAAITLYTQMSLRTDELSSRTREHLEIIAEQAGRAADLVQQILDFSRRAIIERRPLALAPFLKETVNLLEHTLPESIQINFERATGEFMVDADPTRIQQTIVNLALNARDAMPKGGELHIAVSAVTAANRITCVTCGQIVAGDWVQVTVRDTGTGIPPNVLPHIFEPFFTTRAPLGSGLGLAQVYGIVKQHGGHIDVETEAGRGTTFKLYWPSQVSQPEAAKLKPTSLAQGEGETILVVEDNRTIQAALADALEMANYQVLKASNGKEALDIIEQHEGQIPLVLSDWVMPFMGGLELIQKIRQHRPTTKAVILTGHPLSESTKESAPEGIVGWVQKPPNLDQLIETVAQALALAHLDAPEQQ